MNTMTNPAHAASPVNTGNGSATLVLDFDSTFTKVEALDVLAEMIDADVAAIRSLTERAMSGEMGFAEALSQRIAILKPTREDITALTQRLKGEVSASVLRNKPAILANAGKIRIVSGGFHEFIAPVVAEFGIGPDQVLANRLVFDADGRATGVDLDNPLSQDGGKVVALKALNLKGAVAMVGDGWTDFEVFQGGAADRFYAFVENVARPKVVEAARAEATAQVVASFDEVLHLEGYEGRYSFPRSRIKVLLLENIHPAAIQAFRDEGYDDSGCARPWFALENQSDAQGA
jgi:D-3-phosphoglycerate dehydrogenase / 2-oxoglutarate reductase